jgi:hypothetical protein
MRPELLSTARPSPLRLLGFLALVAGAVLAGVGASLTWATVGFPGDATGAADVAVKGVDVWEGTVVLAIAAVGLILMVVMRVTRSTAVRSAIAVGVLAGGLAVTALAARDLARPRTRFGGGAGLDEVARAVAAELGQPVDRIRALLEQNFGAALRVDVGPGLPLTLAGGLLLVVAGGLALLWARRGRASGEEPGDLVPPRGDG